MQSQDKFKLNSDQKAFRSYMLAGGVATAGTIATVSPSHATTTPLTVDSVATQLSSAQTAIIGVGGVLVGMALGVAVFLIGKRIMNNTTTR
jgi:hypothetical protein